MVNPKLSKIKKIKKKINPPILLYTLKMTNIWLGGLLPP